MLSVIRHWTIWLVLLAMAVAVQAAELQHEIRVPGIPDVRQEIRFPDLPGYRTLVCDLHTHTVFSDGTVWPPVRIREAWRQGLHVLAITDHIEYRPHKEDLPRGYDRSPVLAAGEAATRDILLIRGAEITRDTPPGHFNALFVKDLPALEHEDLLEVFRRANAQDAFVFWNHPGWQGAERGKWLELHTTVYENKWLHGIEICNNECYYQQAHQWAIDKNLTLIGTSDVHEPELRRKNTADDHRTVTLVLAKEKTADALKEALRAGRTIVWWRGRLIGREQWLRPFFDACVEVQPPHHRIKNAVFVHVRNRCEADIRLENTGKVGPKEILLPAGTVSLLRIAAADPNKPTKLQYTATNFLIAPEKGLPATFDIPGVQQ